MAEAQVRRRGARNRERHAAYVDLVATGVNRYEAGRQVGVSRVGAAGETLARSGVLRPAGAPTPAAGDSAGHRAGATAARDRRGDRGTAAARGAESLPRTRRAAGDREPARPALRNPRDRPDDLSGRLDGVAGGAPQQPSASQPEAGTAESGLAGSGRLEAYAPHARRPRPRSAGATQGPQAREGPGVVDSRDRAADQAVEPEQIARRLPGCSLTTRTPPVPRDDLPEPCSSRPAANYARSSPGRCAAAGSTGEPAMNPAPACRASRRRPVQRPHGDDQRPPRRGRRPGRARALGGRPRDRQGRSVGDGDPGRADLPLHGAGRAARRPRAPHHLAMPSSRPWPAARTAAQVPHLGPGQRDGRPRRVHASRPTWRSTSATRTRRGNAAPTRTPTGCCASTSPRAPTSPCTPQTDLDARRRTSSTADPRKTLDWDTPAERLATYSTSHLAAVLRPPPAPA